MDVATAVRKIKRQFGDEYNVVINDSDIYDWMHDAELDIIRSTSDNDTKLNVPASNFPLRVPDRVNIKRVSVAGKPLTHTTLTELDLTHDYTNAGGGPIYWFYQSGQINLWPTPVAADKYTVEVLYSKTPFPMSAVASYLQWLATNSPLQEATVPNNSSWKSMVNFNVVLDMAITASGTNWFLTCGPQDHTPANFHWALGFSLNSSGGLAIYAEVSDGVTVKPVSGMTYKTGYVTGSRFKMRVIYNNVIGTVQIFNFDANDTETLVVTSAAHGSFNIQTTDDSPLTLGSTGAIGAAFKLYDLELYDNINSSIAGSIFHFNGATDLPILPGIPLTPFSVASGHSMAVTGGIQKGAFNEFTVPEVYHEDIVKFCLARAHNKNQNWRAAEAEMEQYDRHVSTRRNEAQSTDQPQYKISDPDDFQSEYWYV